MTEDEILSGWPDWFVARVFTWVKVNGYDELGIPLNVIRDRSRKLSEFCSVTPIEGRTWSVEDVMRYSADCEWLIGSSAHITKRNSIIAHYMEYRIRK